ncbi:MAG TPA: LLM class flavin-dependent oxidoreductase [Candidatus Eisenbacteria bacterium]|nr:LLM class flavin-dependent oxidoreductase [Candidatus Eisenbacteria bacterium]
MRFALMIEPQQGTTYELQLAVALRAEAAGFETLFRSDHYASFPGDGEGETTDAWAVLAGLARETTRIGLGTLVSPVTFRHPGNLVKVATTVDNMSGGRLEIGVGAGWNKDDHLPLGLPFPPIEQRAELLEDQLAILHGLWTEPDGWSYEGRHVTVRGGRLRPRPVDVPGRPRAANGMVRPWILTGGEGSPKGFRIAARWADEFNLSSSTPELAAQKFAALDNACQAIGRDPGSVTRSAMVGTLIGADDAAVSRRSDGLMRTFGMDAASGREWLAARRSRWIWGTPNEARNMVRRFGDAGAERLMLQDFLPWDLEMIDLMAAELIDTRP